MEKILPCSDKITIAIPSKGRLKEHVLNYLKAKNYSVIPEGPRSLQGIFEGRNNHRIVFMHPRDIATMLEENIVDVGFTGLDLIADTRAKIRPVIRLDKGHVKMAVLVPEYSEMYHPFHLLHKTVATPFPRITKDFFDQLKVEVNVRGIQGASEGMPYLGVVDAIVDVIESGTTAKENNLKVIFDDLFDSECVAAVHKPELRSNFRLVNQFLRDMYQ